ncbi:hypothetical protein ADUPG1_005377, partial [Aduncisulcus paluster]
MHERLAKCSLVSISIIKHHCCNCRRIYYGFQSANSHKKANPTHPLQAIGHVTHQDLRLLPTTMKKIVTENLSILTTSDEIERRADAMVDEEVRAELDRERATTHTARHSSTSIA